LAQEHPGIDFFDSWTELGDLHDIDAARLKEFSSFAVGEQRRFSQCEYDTTNAGFEDELRAGAIA